MTGAGAESILGVVGGTFSGVPRRARIFGAVAVLYFIGMMLWMVIAFGPREAFMGPYMWGGFCGGLSGLLLGWTGALYSLAQDGRWSMRWRWRVVPTRMNDMLLAVPTLSLISALLATIGAGMILPLVWREWYLAGGLVSMAAIILYAVRLTSDSTRFLYLHAREQAAAAQRAQAEAADARLAALQAQMNPHFLFNALNTIASLVRTDARAAEATTENLAAILRRTLDRSRSTLSTVEDEADYLRAYLAIEQERYGDRLSVDWEIDPAALPVRIPPMTLQPLAENALKHGVGGRLEGGRMRIGVRRVEGALRLEVQDDGAGFAPDARDGTGLGNLRARLATLYGDRASLTIDRLPRGARVVVQLPVEGS
ncbi:MAG TPA: histidine kinase [Longimicrobium sp.]|uniref:sensor histidine kinase n=1 Tax=Longimicrobium sp. TaxID=2029185 RepID=UPI002ED88F51